MHSNRKRKLYFENQEIFWARPPCYIIPVYFNFTSYDHVFCFAVCKFISSDIKRTFLKG